MEITVIKPGILSTVQDLGRHFYRHQAIPAAGAMDPLSMRIANLSLGNSPTEAVIEITYADVSIFAETDLLIAYSGESCLLYAGKQALPANRPLFIPAGQYLDFSHLESGSRTYLAILGGWDVRPVLGSKSTYLEAQFGGLSGRCLKKGDKLRSSENLTQSNKRILASLKGLYINFPSWSVHKERFTALAKKTIRVVPGKEFTWFRADSLLSFLSSSYTLSRDCNRMGYRFNGQGLSRSVQTELLSTAVAPGTIQVTNDGSLMLLMADSQTTGGYPRIAQVAQIDIPLCAQLKPGDVIHFSAISRIEAEKLYLNQEKELKRLAVAINILCSTTSIPGKGSQ
ncbi:biotin-dependent carboxyltransferase family protein [Olivibacter sp. XZL3]|uniref:5-oxoprolinase subunit C family protein n=1 Tax=Olivibacter sp. XZL3 TaxID=1735116 RepID=UPI001066E3F7|nr:biotin-dependent carboxyltransferase family protein [Olivibacter sp. XZL3]